MKTPKKSQEVTGTLTPSLKTPKNKNKMNTPKSVTQNLQKLETPKSIKKNKQKDTQSPKLTLKNGDSVMATTQQKEVQAKNKTPKNKTPKQQNGAKQNDFIATSEKKKKLSDSEESILNKVKKNPKKRTIDEVVSVKKSKVGNQQSEKLQKSSESSTSLNLSDEVIIEFPPGAKCYKSALKQIVNMSHQVSNPRTLIITFKDEADSKKNLPLLQKLQVGNQNINVTQLVDNIDPLKKVTLIRRSDSDSLDPADIHEAVKSTSYSRLVNVKTGQTQGIYVFTFASKEEATAAEEKNFKIKGREIKLRSYFIDANNQEEAISPEKKKRKQNVEASDASAKKKSKVNVIAKKEESDDEEDDDDDDDDEEEEVEGEDDDDVEGEDDEEEGGDEDDDDEEEDDDDDDDDE